MYRYFEIEKGKCVSIKLLKKDLFILGKYDSGEILCDLGIIIMCKIWKVVYVIFIKIRRNIYFRKKYNFKCNKKLFGIFILFNNCNR